MRVLFIFQESRCFMDLTAAETIAQSQFVWAILCIFMTGGAIVYLVKKQSLSDEKNQSLTNKLMRESKTREDKLFNNLSSLTKSQERTASSIEGLNQSFNRLQQDHSNLAKEVVDIKVKLEKEEGNE